MVTARDRRALRWGVGAVVVAVFLLRVVPAAARSLVSSRRDLAERAALLARGRVELAQAHALGDSAAALARALVRLAPQLVAGGSAPEAGADLAGRLNLAAARAPARLERVDPLADSTRAGRLRRVRAMAVIETDVRGLAAFLRATEFGAAALTVERLAVVSADPSAGDRGPERLRVEVTVAGWYLARTDARVEVQG